MDPLRVQPKGPGLGLFSDPMQYYKKEMKG